ncbi:MAG TPA: signal recognition particle protein [Dehalococcoidia bacterium]|nr:signal recognition particle protein [Dehalococcoidia bacterium]
MFEALTDKLQRALRRLGSHGIVTEKDLDEALREVRLALLEADVHFRVVKDLIGRVRERALGAQVLKSLTPTQQVIAIVQQELTEVLGGGQSRLQLSPHPPTVVMLVGLQGSGKTTTAAKLALHTRKQGQRPLLVAADLRRPAAVEQLATLGRQLDIPVLRDSTSVSALAQGALAEARRTGATVVIVDTGGRLHIDEAMMAEVLELKKLFSYPTHPGLAALPGPSEVLLVADAMTGQDALRSAEAFHQALGLTGIILTKMDGDARGGAALSMRAVTGLPIKFIGVGEKADALEAFHPDRIASRILGMGDIMTLVEKAQEAVSQEEAQKLAARAKRGELNLEDFLAQLRQMRQMGPLRSLLAMVPGLGQLQGALPEEGVDEKLLKRAEAVIFSMTPEERRRPEIIDGSRRRRIARGSGTSVQDVNMLLKQFQEAKRMVQMMAGANPRNLLRLRR